MIMLTRTLALAGALAGGIATSQMPEFSQQYQQRLGGALEELQTVVADFEADANRNGLSPDEALAAFRQSPDRFFRDRGVSMAKTLERYQGLIQERARFEQWPEMAKPLAIARQHDPTVLAGAWQNFRPALPATVTGGLYAAGGGLVGWLTIFVLVGLLLAPFRRRPPNKRTVAVANGNAGGRENDDGSMSISQYKAKRAARRKGPD